MKERGFTIAEALIVLAIIAILSYLLFPLFLKVKRQVQIYSSVSKLRQIHLAIENYRQAWDGADVFTSYRSYHKLGLPDWDQRDRDENLWKRTRPWGLTNSSHLIWLSPCATRIYEYDVITRQSTFFLMTPESYIGLMALAYRPTMIELPVRGNASALYKDYIPRYRQNIVIAADPYCNPPGTNMEDAFLYKRGLALLLSGQIVHRYAQGNAFFLEWWSDPPED